MSKEYVKPEISTFEIKANEAIAACSVITAGWQLSDKRESGKYYPTRQAALDAQPDQKSGSANIVAPVYHVTEEHAYQYWTDKRSVYWEDWNDNGVFDSGDITYNQQGNLPEMMQGGKAVPVQNS
jgi:hypothetical protein